MLFSARTPNYLMIFYQLALILLDNKNLGYIFNLTRKNNSYSLSYLYFTGAAYLNFNIDRKSNKLKIPIQTTQLHKRKWIKVKVDFNLKEDNVKIYIDNQYIRLMV
jgi:hypothetical protein